MEPWMMAAARTMDRDVLWTNSPPLLTGCEHDLELLPVIEARFTVICRKCGGLDVDASRAIGSSDPDAPEYVILADSSVKPLRKPGADSFAAFCYARLDEDEAAAKAASSEHLCPAARGGRWQHVGSRNIRYSNGCGETMHAIDVTGGPCLWYEQIWVKGDSDSAVTSHIVRHDPARALRQVRALRLLVADCEKALRFPANGPLANLARRTLAGIASIWEDHPDYAAAGQP